MLDLVDVVMIIFYVKGSNFRVFYGVIKGCIYWFEFFLI